MIAQPKIGLACHSLRLDGGMGRYSLAVVKGLNELGIKPVVFTKKINKQDAGQLKFKLELINCRFLPTKIRDHYYNIITNNRAKKYSFDAIISCNRYPNASIIVCGGTHKGYLSAINKQPSFFDKLMIRQETVTYQNSQLVIAHTEIMAREVENFYSIEKNKIHTIYPPFDTKKFNADALSQDEILNIRAQFNIPEKNIVFLLLSAGNHFFKGLDIATNFFNETDLPITLLVAGRHISSSKNVIYIGFRKDIEKIYKVVDYTISASRYEPFGMVAIESILSGTPVVLSNRVGANELILPDAKNIFDPFDSNSLHKAILTAIANKRRLINPIQYISQHDNELQHVSKILHAASLL